MGISTSFDRSCIVGMRVLADVCRNQAVRKQVWNARNPDLFRHCASIDWRRDFKLLRKNVENGDGNEGDDVVQAEPTTKQKDEAVQSEDMVDAKA
mmetsp:Transcript_1456/g.2976  ORF Transcript_1456/g.2976 Transcript_1456/m.2976 type:complete len:95 (+) Transcript_1456:2176-2460(+)